LTISYMKLPYIVLIILILSSLPPNTLSLQYRDQPIMAFVNLVIDPMEEISYVDIQIVGLRNTSIDMYFATLSWWVPRGGLCKIEILSNAEKMSDYLYRVPVVNGVAEFSYRLWIPLKENYERRTHKLSGIDTNFAVLVEGIVFARPSNLNLAKSIPVILKIKINDPTWIVLTPFKEANKNTYYVHNFVELSRYAIVAGKPKYYKLAILPLYNMTYTLFYPPSFIEEISDRLFVQDPFIFYKYIDREKDASAYMNATRFYMEYYSNLFSEPPPSTVNLVWYVNAIHWRGFWHIDRGHREHHITHHLIHFWFPSIVDTGIDEGIAMYYDVWGAYALTKKSYFLAYNYVRYILFERGVRERLLAGKDPWMDFIKSYGLQPMIAMYLEYLIQTKSNGVCTLADLLKYLVHYRKYESFSYNDYPDLVKQALNIDIENEYKEALRTYDFSRMFDFVYKDYGVYMDELLDYLRDNHGAPPILYYIYLELGAKIGNPEQTTYNRWAFYEEPLLTTSKTFREELLKKLREKYPLTRPELIEILNSYTNGGSSDFFEYYSSRFPIPPRIEDLNAWINGTYAKVVDRLAYIKQALQRYGEYLNGSVRNVLWEIVDRIDKYLDSGEVLKTLEISEKGVDLLNSELMKDSDGDDLADVYERIYGLDPYNTMTIPLVNDSIRTMLSVDGYAYEWGRLPSVKAMGWGDVEEIKVLYHDGHIYGYAKLRKPIYDLFASIVLIIRPPDRSWEWEIEVRMPTIPWTSDILYICPYMATIGNIIEFQIPLNTVEIGLGSIPRELEVILWIDESPIGREALGGASATITINESVIAYLDMRISAKEGYEDTPIIIYGVTFPVNATIELEIIHDQRIEYSYVHTDSHGFWVYVYIPHTEGVYTIKAVYREIVKNSTITVKPRVTVRSETVTNTVIKTTTTTTTVTRTKTETSYITKTETPTTTMVSIVERTATITRVETLTVTSVSTVEKLTTITRTVAETLTTTATPTPLPTATTVNWITTVAISVVLLVAGFAVGYIARKR